MQRGCRPGVVIAGDQWGLQMATEDNGRRALHRPVDEACGPLTFSRPPHLPGSGLPTSLVKIVSGLAIGMLATTATAEPSGFDQDKVGGLPAGWICGSTDGGAPRWRVEADDSAPSPPNVLKQSGSGSFPWCVKQGTALADGLVEVKFMPLAGEDDRAGGVVWRWKDADSYYVARADARDANVSLHYVAGAKLRFLKQASAPVSAGTWHTLRVEFKGVAIRVLLDGKLYIEFEDSHIEGEGAVGV